MEEAYASYRLLPALRLVCLEDSGLEAGSGRLEQWRRQVDGLEPWEGEEGGRVWEEKTRKLLVVMCDWVAAEAEAGRVRAAALGDRFGGLYGIECVQELWLEGQRVCEGVRGAIDGGQSVW